MCCVGGVGGVRGVRDVGRGSRWKSEHRHRSVILVADPAQYVEFLLVLRRIGLLGVSTVRVIGVRAVRDRIIRIRVSVVCTV